VKGSHPKAIQAGVVDADDRIIGDINFFLYPSGDDERGDEKLDSQPDSTPAAERKRENRARLCVGEIDVMIADRKHRSRGLGRAAVTAFLAYIHRNLDAILAEYAAVDSSDEAPTAAPIAELTAVMAKINATNTASVTLFTRLGFVPHGGVNYFGERELRLENFEHVMTQRTLDWVAPAVNEVVEVEYQRRDDADAA
jgi:RimJ/RimL family protein N-acetyltransferase